MSDCYDDKALSMIPKRKPNSHKGNYGHTLVIAGSYGMSGAAFLSSMAAYKTGTGLVKIYTPECNRIILQVLEPEAIIETYEPEAVVGRDYEYNEKISELIEWADVIIIGPGMSTCESSERLLEDVMEAAYMPMIIDADAINILANRSDLLKYYREQIIITPHPGEMSRLAGIPVEEIDSDKENVAGQYAQTHGIICALKGHDTVVARSDGRTYINTTGGPELSKGGSGDVLTGIIAGLICLGLDEWKAATLGCYIHGKCGTYSAESKGENGVIARDLLEAIPEVMKS